MKAQEREADGRRDQQSSMIESIISMNLRHEFRGWRKVKKKEAKEKVHLNEGSENQANSQWGSE